MTLHTRITRLLAGVHPLTAEDICQAIPGASQAVLDAMLAAGHVTCERGGYRVGAVPPPESDAYAAADKLVRDLTKQRAEIDAMLRDAIAERDALRAS